MRASLIRIDLTDEGLAHDAGAHLVTRDGLKFTVAGGRWQHTALGDGVEGLKLLRWELLK